MSVRYKVNGSVITIPTGGAGGNGNVWEGTSAEYEAEKDTIEKDTIILINDDIAPAAESYPASNVTYDNTKTEVEATNIQDAVDNINQNLNTFQFREVDGKAQYKLESEGADAWRFFNIENFNLLDKSIDWWTINKGSNTTIDYVRGCQIHITASTTNCEMISKPLKLEDKEYNFNCYTTSNQTGTNRLAFYISIDNGSTWNLLTNIIGTSQISLSQYKNKEVLIKYVSYKGISNRIWNLSITEPGEWH